MIFLVMAIQVFAAPRINGQDNLPPDSLLAKVQAIPIAEISVKATEMSSIIAEKRKILLTYENRVRTDSIVNSVLVRYDRKIEDPIQTRLEDINSRELGSLLNEWKFVSVRLTETQKTLTNRVGMFENEKAALQIRLHQWKLTHDQAMRENVTQTMLEQIGSTIKAIEILIGELNENSDFIQDGLVKISEKLISSNEIIQDMEVLHKKTTVQRFKFNKPVIWKDRLYVKDTSYDDKGYLGANLPVIKSFYRNNKSKLEIHLVLLILIILGSIALFRWLQKNIDKKDEKYVAQTRILMSKPVAAGLMTAFTLTLVIYDIIPDVIRSFNAILVLVPMILLIAHNFYRSIRKYLYLLLLFVVLVVFYNLTFKEDLFSRLLLLMITSGTLLATITMMRDKAIWEITAKSVSIRLLYNLLYIIGSFMGIAVVTNLFGGPYIAEFFGISTLYSIVTALLVYAFVAIVKGFLIMIIYSKGASSLTVIQNFGPMVEKRIGSTLNLAGLIIWLFAVMKEYLIRDAIFGWFNRVFISPIPIGSIQFTLLNIILFIFIIWLTITISRIIKFFLRGDIVSGMKKGVPGAISLMLRIIIITIGFLFAIAAAGIKMEKLTILLGAFGVGIGFGLQNIFNNLISGIILAFERPINKGDIIEVGAVMGIVKEIGIRASVIKTYDGSEVIVPNGNLISNELINWTLSDQRRRGEVLLGVAFGTDPQRVLDLLLEAAVSNERVLENPKPWAIFLGFGESSLNFRLLFWIGDAETRLTVQSEITVKINQMIKEEGIEIPFPQRDLHLRSADAGIFDRIHAVDESISKKTGAQFPKPGKQKKDPGELPH